MAEPGTQQRSGGVTVPQVARILPGPAGKLQKLAAAGALQQATPELLGLKDQYIPNARSQTPPDDVAFHSSAWSEGTIYANSLDGQLHTVKMAKELSLGKVAKMLVVLGSIQPSGTNSAFCKVKDPTASIGAALQRSVLQHQQYQQGHMGPGAVVLLQQVSVFTPAPGTSYLAVTAKNIVKVWSGESTYDRIRQAQHLPAQQQPQQQQRQQQAPVRPQGPPTLNSQLGSSGQHPAAGAESTQQRPQAQQRQGQQMQTYPMQHRRPPPQQASLSVAGSNHSSVFPPPSPDVSSIFAKTRQQPASGQQPQAPGGQQQRPQQQQSQQQQGPADTASGLAAQHDSELVQNQRQMPQVQPVAGGAGRGLMLPPAPRLQSSTFRAQLHKQQQAQQQTPPNPQRQPQAPTQQQFVTGRQAQQGIQSQLFDSLLDDLVDLEQDGGPATESAARQAPIQQRPLQTSQQSGPGSQYVPGALLDHINSANHNRSSVASRPPVATPGPPSMLPPSQQQQHSQQSGSALQQQQGPNSQFVPGALLDQINGATIRPAAAKAHPAAPACNRAAMNDSEGDDAVDDVVAAIFGSQMAPTAAPARHGQAGTKPAAASIFGSQLTAPVAARPAGGGLQQSANRGQHGALLNQQQMRPPRGSAPGLAPPTNKLTTQQPASSGVQSSNKGIGAAALGTPQAGEQQQQKRFKASPATGCTVGRPLQPVNGNAQIQLQGLQQQPKQPIQQQKPPQLGLQWPQARASVSGASMVSSVAGPAKSGAGLRAAGAAALLDDLVGNDLDELEDL